MSIGRDTLKATMRRTWDAIKNQFRRQTIEEAHLQDDYPTISDSDFTDDEERQREWQRHLNRRATIATEGMTNFGGDGGVGPDVYDNRLNDKWDCVSEYSVSFPSDSSINDAFKEEQYEIQANRHNRLVSPIKEDAVDEKHSYKYGMKDERQLRHMERRMSLHPPLERHDSFSNNRRGRSPHGVPKFVVRERINKLEKSPSKRSDSLHPYAKMVDNLALRRESSERESENVGNTY